MSVRREVEMQYDERDDVFTLVSGKRFYAHRSVLGISRTSDGTVAVSEGWDGGVDDSQFDELDRCEIAEHAIALWREWAYGITP